MIEISNKCYKTDMGGLAGWCGILSPGTNKNMTPTRLELAIFWFEVRRLIQLGYEADV